ncbi:MAG: hypothetical protein AB7V50_11575 [Vampirovibrionia bacterium]
MIKKLFSIIISLFFLLNTTVSAQVLEGGIEENWTVNNARKEAFKDVPFVKDLSWAPVVDPYYSENMHAKQQNIKQIKNRIITFFDTGNYAIHEKGSNNTFYFSDNGQLNAVEYGASKTFPMKSYKYRYPEGTLFTLSLDINNSECFIFKPNGKLIYHWINNKCYTEAGKLHMTRYSVKY